MIAERKKVCRRPMTTSEQNSKRVLMVAYSYPPIETVGSVRTAKFAKYLAAYGWQPTVLTVSNDMTSWLRSEAAEADNRDVRVIRACFPDLSTFIKEALFRLGLFVPQSKKGELAAKDAEADGRSRLRKYCGSFLYWVKGWLAFPDTYILWFPFAFIRGLKELRAKKYHVIYSTSIPVTDHLIAAALHRITGIPWVADFRDPWTQNPFFAQGLSEKRLAVERRLEKRILSGTSAILTVSEPLAELLKEFHGERPFGVFSITSGYDPDDYSSGMPPKRDRLCITYTGSLYGMMRDPTSILETVDELIEDGNIDAKDIVVRFFGPLEEGLLRLKERLKNKEIIEINGIVPRKESIARQQESAAILIIQWDDSYTKKLYGGKIFEHLGSRRPILALTHDDGILAELIRETGAGVVCSNKSQVKEALLAWLEEYRTTGEIKYNGIDEEVGRYRWDSLTGEFAGLLDRIYRADKTYQ